MRARALKKKGGIEISGRAPRPSPDTPAPRGAASTPRCRGNVGGQAMPQAVGRLMMQGSMEYHPDYVKVAAPALSFAAVGWSPAMDRHVRSLPPPERRQAEAFRDEVMVPYQRGEIDRFRAGMRNGRVVELADTDHHCFIQSRARVAREMRAFLLAD